MDAIPVIRLAEERLEELSQALGIGVGKGRTGHGAQAQMLQSPDVGSQAAAAVAHASAANQVNEEQTNELILPRECPGAPAGTVFLGQGLEFLPGNQG